MKINNDNGFVLLICLSYVLLLSCSSPIGKNKSSKSSSGWQIRVDNPSGDSPKGKLFLNLPYNIGSRDSLAYILYAPRIEKGDSVGVRVLGGLEVYAGNDKIPIVLSVPVDTDLVSIPIADFSDFTTRYSSVMWMTEFYLKQAYGYDRIVQWFDKEEALKYIGEYSKHSKDK